MRKTFSITDGEVLKHLDKQKNKSKYIEELILADINKKDKNSDDIEAVVEKVVLKYLKSSIVKTIDNTPKFDKKAKKSALGILK